VEELKQSKLARSALGNYVFEKFVEAKTKEWDEYRLQVTDWETRRYLHI